ncbi:hypothetical protein [Pyruvatibacter sp.]|uniref:hypothetical protein n=1 Tax=Pyruvatibacter sp. TaxID=1981328 RepID=UPI0032ED95BB
MSSGSNTTMRDLSKNTMPHRLGATLEALYAVGFSASVLALVWQDMVTDSSALPATWDSPRWGVALLIALGKALVWPLYWLARVLGIDTGI